MQKVPQFCLEKCAVMHVEDVSAELCNSGGLDVETRSCVQTSEREFVSLISRTVPTLWARSTFFKFPKGYIGTFERTKLPTRPCIILQTNFVYS
jgi:hypothetical protein